MTNITKNRGLIIVSGILITLFLSMGLESLNTPQNQKDIYNPIETYTLKTQGLELDNNYTGVGEPLNVIHYANRTDSASLSFTNNSYELALVKSGFGWTGYKLNATVKNLKDRRQWINGSMNFGANLTYAVPDDDSNDTPLIGSGWVFNERDESGGIDNDMSGNYMDGTAGWVEDNRDCLELRMNGAPDGPTRFTYESDDECSWIYNTIIPRGQLFDSSFYIDINPVYLCPSNYWGLKIEINDQEIFSIGNAEMTSYGIGNWTTFNLPQEIWSNSSDVFTAPLHSTSTKINITLENTAAGDYSYGFEDGGNLEQQWVLIDDVELDVLAEAMPTQVNLLMNQSEVLNITYGMGTAEVTGNWNGTELEYVNGNFSSQGSGLYGGYEIQFDTELNLFAMKSNQNTTYEKDANSPGTSFSVSNNSMVDWEFFSFIATPTGYVENSMTIEFSTDLTLNWVSNAQQPSINITDQCTLTPGVLIVPVSDVATSANGFWTFKGTSPNYCEQITVYNNATGSWVEDNTFLSGEYINITGKITDSALISGYIQQTMATLQIRFPNGSIWTNAIQSKSLDATGNVYFDAIQIPSAPPDYEIGEYDVIITWENSHSSFGMNETGIIYKKFSVVHYTEVTPEQLFYQNIPEDSIINLKVSFNDRENNDAIKGAQVYTYNFTNPGVEKYFSEISPGFYLLEFNVSGANAGNNTLIIYANSSLYVNNEINITIHVIKDTSLTKGVSFVTVPWSENFTIQFNYTEASTGTGIDTMPSHNWLDDTNIIQTALGRYNITCNSSAYQVNQQHSLIIDVSEFGYTPQSILVKIAVIERNATLGDMNLNQTATSSISYPFGDLLNITVKYSDISSGRFIDSNNVELKKGATTIGSFSSNLVLEQYNYTLNTSSLDIGVNVLTIAADENNYSAAFSSITITVYERDTFLEVYVNDILSSSFDFYNTSIGDLLNITVWYRDNITVGNPNIELSTMQLIGMGAPRILDAHPSYDQYNITIDATELGKGVGILTISSEKHGYIAMSENIVVNVKERKTNLTLSINDTSIAEGQTYEAEIGEYINITVSFRDYIAPYNYIENATIELLGFGVLTNQSALEQYNVTISAAQLDPGVNILTLYAQKSDYQAQTLYFYIEIVDKNTTIQLFLNEIDKTAEESVEVYIGDLVNITLKYTDISGSFIENASVDIRGEGITPTNLTENKILEHYNITLNTGELGLGVNILTLFADQTNHVQQSIKILILVLEKPTDFQIFINNINRTQEKTFELPLGAELNITVKYYDNTTKLHVDNASIELRDGATVLGAFTETGQQYTIILDTEDVLDIGLRILTIICQKGNYTSQSPNIRINIRRVNAEILEINNQTVKTQRPGETINIQVSIKNNDFGGSFTGSLVVKYTWELGQGELTDSNNDGTYEVSLENVPEGTYTLTITAYAGDDYEIKRLTIDLIIRTPEEEVTMFRIILVIAIGAAIGVGGYIIVYQRVLKYPVPVRKVRTYRKKYKKQSVKADVIPRNEAFNSLYLENLGSVAKLIKSKQTSVKKSIVEDEKGSIESKGAPKEEPKVAPKEEPKVAPKELPIVVVPKEEPKVAPKEEPKVAPKELPKIAPKELPKVAPKEEPKVAPKEEPKVAPKELPKIAPKELPKVAPKELPKVVVPKELPKVAPKELPKVAPKELPKKEPKGVNIKIEALETEIKQLMIKDELQAAGRMAELAALYKEVGEIEKAQKIVKDRKKLAIKSFKNTQAEALKKAKKAEKEGNWATAADAYLEAKNLSEQLLKAGLADETDNIKEFASLEAKYRKEVTEVVKEIPKDIKVKIDATEKEINQLMKKDKVQAVQMMSELANLYKSAGEEKIAQQILDDQRKLTIQTLKELQAGVLENAKNAEKEKKWETAANAYLEAKIISENLLNAGLADEAEKIKELESLEANNRKKIK